MLYKFRGIEFNVKTVTYGRTGKPAEADFLAAEADSQGNQLDNMDFHIQGYIYGRSVEETRIKLEQALEKKEGLLVMHDGRSAEVKIEEGWHIVKDEEFDDKYTLDFNFKKIDNDSLSLKIIALKELSDKKLARILTAAEDSAVNDFNQKFAVEGFPGFVKIQTFDNLTSLAKEMSKRAADRMLGQVINPVVGSLDIMAAGVGGIATAVLSYTKLRDLLGSLPDGDYFRAYLDFLPISSKAKKPVYESAAAEQVYQNAAASEQLIHQSALLQAINEAVNHKEYISNDEAEQTIEKLKSAAETVTFETDSQEIQSAINQAVDMGIEQIKQKHIVATTFKSYSRSFPAVVIAHKLYGSESVTDKALKMQKRNQIHNALFMPAGIGLEVEEA